MRFFRRFFLFCTLCLSICAFASADEVSNTFVGTIDGESVVAYLDSTSVTYFSGDLDDDLDALFVSFDDFGKPKYRVAVRVGDFTTERTYSEGNGQKKDYFAVRMVYNTDDLSFGDYYRIVESATDWTVSFTTIDREEGIFKGSVKATLTPSKYNHSPFPYRESVQVEGTFEFQAKSIHPVMEEYRSRNTAYAERYNSYYVTTIGGGYSGGTTTNNFSDSLFSSCFSCGGTKRCSTCGGDGKLDVLQSPLLGNYCRACSGTGKCIWCK